MATFDALNAAAVSVTKLIDRAVKAKPVRDRVPNAKATLVRTEDFDAPVGAIARPAVSVFVHRVDFDKVMRASFAAPTRIDGPAYLPLEMRFLITPWADNAEDELSLLGAAMLALESTPILAGSLLAEPATWEPDESLQIVLEDISTEAVMRMFDSLPVDYQLSVPYIARLVKLALPIPQTHLTSSVHLEVENHPRTPVSR